MTTEFQDYESDEKKLYSPFCADTQAPAAKTFWLVTSFALVASAIGSWGRNKGDFGAAKDPAVGHRLTSLQLRPIDGGAALRLPDLKGLATFSRYWGPWSHKSKRLLPQLVELLGKFGSRNEFRMLAVSCADNGNDTNREHAQQTKQYLSAIVAKFPAYLDADYSSRTTLGVIAELDRMGYPFAVLLGRDGRILAALARRQPRGRNGDGTTAFPRTKWFEQVTRAKHD